jgi:hypothetical protein
MDLLRTSLILKLFRIPVIAICKQMWAPMTGISRVRKLGKSLGSRTPA